MQLFPGLVLDRARVILQPVHVATQVQIFPLQRLHLFTEVLFFLPLLLVGGQAVVPKDHAVTHDQGQRGSDHNGHLALPGEQPGTPLVKGGLLHVAAF